MGRCKYEKLKNLEPAFDEIRSWAHLKEPKPGIFYIRSQSFLHFHEKDDVIWADVKGEENWEPVAVPKKITKKFLKDFVRAIRSRYSLSSAE